MIDYKELLIKYINYVGYEEGTTHIPVYGDEFTDEEKAELDRLDALGDANPFAAAAGREG